MVVPQKNNESSEEQPQGDLEQQWEECNDLFYVPLLQVIQPVLPQFGEPRRVSGEPSLILVQPLLDENTDGGGRQAADEGREPEDVDGDSPRLG